MTDIKNLDLLNYRLELFSDAIKMVKKPKKVPILSNFWAWMILDAGYKLSEAILNYKIMQEVVIRFQEKYDFDYIGYTGARLNRVRNVFGNSPHKINNENEYVQYNDVALLENSELEELAQNFNKCLWEKVLPRKYEKFNNEMTGELLREAGLEMVAWAQSQQEVSDRLLQEYSVPRSYMSTAKVINPTIEMIFDRFRGIKGLSMDLHRTPERLEYVLNELDNAMIIPMLKELEQSSGRDESQVFDCVTVLLAHTILNPKQFERFIWPTLKKILDTVVKTGKTLYLFVEGNSKPLWNYLGDYPKGHIALHIEQDDIFECRKRLPNICLVGGMPVSLLGMGSKQQCIDYAKKLINEIGADGGYILSQNKMVCSRNECIPENLKAVNEFVKNYQ